MSDDNLILHNLHFITAHISFITAYLCGDNPYHILLIICSEKVLLFHVFTFIPKKTFTVTSFYDAS